MKLAMTPNESNQFDTLLNQIDGGKEQGVLVTNAQRGLLIKQMVYIRHRCFTDEDYAIYWHKDVYYKVSKIKTFNGIYRVTALKAWTFEREYDPTWFFEDTM